MRMNKNTILITGGSGGIGFSLAEAFLERGNTVIVCGRNEQHLREAAEKHPEMHTKVCDVSVDSQRVELFSWVQKNFPELNVLINNAGIQRDIDFTKGVEDLVNGGDEIRINIDGPVYLSALFIPLLAGHQDASIINISSVLGFVPMARVPVYCATKAFLHSFSLSLRFQLKKTCIQVYEVLPPRVKTGLNAEGRRKMGYAETGLETKEFISEVMRGLEKNENEIEYPSALSVIGASREELDTLFSVINKQDYDIPKTL